MHRVFLSLSFSFSLLSQWKSCPGFVVDFLCYGQVLVRLDEGHREFTLIRNSGLESDRDQWWVFGSGLDFVDSDASDFETVETLFALVIAADCISGLLFPNL
ncbi:unnamed protein product [Microthlaspi erraticum]|uniref:Uncharacterized protein n=1 Tax=Microthlaspi erraticum TaxID=1685480 RepID=A0A6D2I5Y1_9BRAS|nr:unnamed protein product [Microthlaspi erraticum]